MEISEIHKASSLAKVQKKTAVSSTSKIEDRVQISVEAEKRMKWVEMLKTMEEIRPEKIEAAKSVAVNQEVTTVITQKLLSDAF